MTLSRLAASSPLTPKAPSSPAVLSVKTRHGVTPHGFMGNISCAVIFRTLSDNGFWGPFSFHFV